MHHTHKYYLKILKFKFILHRVFTSRFSFTVYFTQQINKGVNRYNIYFIFKYSVEIKNNLLSTLLYIEIITSVEFFSNLKLNHK